MSIVVTAKRPRVPGFDLTFSAPKSVSVLYALSSGAVNAEGVAAHEAAVDTALSYLERHAVFTTRRRRDGEMEVLPAKMDPPQNSPIYGDTRR